MSENIYAVRTNQLRSRMQQEDLRAYLIPMNDFHGSEYIGDYFKTIAWFSGRFRLENPASFAVSRASHS